MTGQSIPWYQHDSPFKILVQMGPAIYFRGTKKRNLEARRNVAVVQDIAVGDARSI